MMQKYNKEKAPNTLQMYRWDRLIIENSTKSKIEGFYWDEIGLYVYGKGKERAWASGYLNS
jgi:hypothetical protein